MAYYQLLTPSLSPVNSNLPVTVNTPEFMQDPVTDAFRGRAWYLWSDPRANGLNVYAANVEFEPTDVDDPDNASLPDRFVLNQNYPNPFNPSTEISFSLPTTSEVTLTVYNVLGRRVITLAEGTFAAGEHKVSWNATDSKRSPVSSGVYFYKLSIGDRSETRKMLLVK